MRKAGTIAIAVFLLAQSASPAAAKRLLPHLTKAKAAAVQTTPGATAKFRSDRNAVIVTFSGMNKIKTIDYSLSYDTNDITQGSKGVITPAASNTEVRELIFGTASKGIYRYDTNIKNGKLVVTISQTNGKKIIKTFTLKV
jgi:hypothetical protein